MRNVLERSHSLNKFTFQNPRSSPAPNHDCQGERSKVPLPLPFQKKNLDISSRVTEIPLPRNFRMISSSHCQWKKKPPPGAANIAAALAVVTGRSFREEHKKAEWLEVTRQVMMSPKSCGWKDERFSWKGKNRIKTGMYLEKNLGSNGFLLLGYFTLFQHELPSLRHPKTNISTESRPSSQLEF